MKNEILLSKLAEFIIAQSLSIDNTKSSEQDSCDLIYKERRIAVKTSDTTNPVFDISLPNQLGIRTPDLYIFALYYGEIANKPQDANLWNFWVLSTPNINMTFEDQETVSLDLLKTIAIKTDYSGLRSAVDLTVAA